MRRATLAALLMMLTGATNPEAAANAAVRSGLVGTRAKGLAVAIVADGRVVFRRSYGLRNAKGEALTRNTFMYGASLTKTVFA